MMPKSRTLTEMMRMYSVEPVPIARSLRESMRLSDHIQAIDQQRREEPVRHDAEPRVLADRHLRVAEPEPRDLRAEGDDDERRQIAQPEAQGVARAPVRRRRAAPSEPRPDERAHRRWRPVRAPRAPGSFRSAASSPHRRDWTPQLPFRARRSPGGDTPPTCVPRAPRRSPQPCHCATKRPDPRLAIFSSAAIVTRP